MSPGGEDAGAFRQRVTDSDVLEALREQPDPVATAGELAEALIRSCVVRYRR